MITKEFIQEVLEKLEVRASYSDALPKNFEFSFGHLIHYGVRRYQIGKSRSGRHVLYGGVVGDDNKPTITLTGNCHSEEVIGPLTIITLLGSALGPDALLKPLIDQFRIVTIPQMNPDGAAENASWIKDPTPKNRIALYYRDHRGQDVEHGIAMANETYQRPEPSCLVDFYKKEAAGRTKLYVTFHSSSLEPGASFLTGNEDEGVMAPAFALIRELAPTLGLPLKTEDLNGRGHFRKVSDGLYSVPRREEMAAGFRASGASDHGFLTNSLQWMESFGTPVSLVSEVPTVIARAYTEEETLGQSALATVVKMYPIYREHVEALKAVIDNLNGPLRVEVENEISLRNITEYFYSHGFRKLEEFVQYLPTYEGRPALRLHQAKLESLQYRMALKRAGLAVSILKNGPARQEWQQKMDEAYEKLDEILGLEMVPIETQIKMQILLVLSGALVAQNL